MEKRRHFTFLVKLVVKVLHIYGKMLTGSGEGVAYLFILLNYGKKRRCTIMGITVHRGF